MYENYPYYYPPVNQPMPQYPIQPQPQQYQPQQYQPQVKIKLDLVQNKTAAEVYKVEIGQKVVLMDVDNASVYVRERGLDGKVTSQDYDLVLHKEEPVKEEPKVDMTKYVKKEDISRIVSDEVEKRMAQMLKPAKKQRSDEE